MFGRYDIPLKIEREGISLSVEKEAGGPLYRRDCLGEQRKSPEPTHPVMGEDAQVLDRR